MLLTTLLASAIVAPSAFKCAMMSNQVATSGDRSRTVVVSRDGKVWIYGKGNSVRPIFSTKWNQFGHHVEVRVSQTGDRIVLVDMYAGAQVLDGNGALIAEALPEKVLNQEELDNRPHKWTCHPEGHWLQDSKVFFGEDKVVLTLCTGKTLDLLSFVQSK